MGHGPRDAGFDRYTKWKKGADPAIFLALERYGRYCAGQFVGMGETLNVEAIRFACEADRIQSQRWAAVTEEMFLIHRAAMKHAERKANG